MFANLCFCFRIVYKSIHKSVKKFYFLLQENINKNNIRTSGRKLIWRIFMRVPNVCLTHCQVLWIIEMKGTCSHFIHNPLKSDTLTKILLQCGKICNELPQVAIGIIISKVIIQLVGIEGKCQEEFFYILRF